MMILTVDQRRPCPSITHIISRFTALVVAYCTCSLLVLLLASSSRNAATAAPAPVTVTVGVVVDLRSEAGRKSRTCIEMALEDLYLQRPSSTTRVLLDVRDSHGNITEAGKIYSFPFFIVQSNHLL